MSGISSAYAKLPFGVYVIAGAAALLGSLSANPLLSVVAIISLVSFIKLLWRPGEPPVLAFAVSFQWLQVTSKVFHANYLVLPVESLRMYSEVTGAIWASLAGLWVLTLGIRFGLRNMRALPLGMVDQQARSISITRVGLLYVGLTILTSGAAAFASGMGGLRQIILAAASVKWVAYFVFAYLCLYRREKYGLLILATAFEVVQGIGFFSGFKTVLFLLVIVIVTARVKVRMGSLAGITAVGMLLLVMGLAWTAIKGEYREFLNQGTSAQSVVVSDEQMLAKLGEMVFALDPSDLVDAADPLFRRLAYVDFFAATMDYVPAVAPHERGALWSQSVMHVLRPRLLFPNKPVLPSDSELTMAYTGLYLASDAAGTSISIGYMGESYIDFGIPGMFIPIFLLGIFWGGIYRFFFRRPDLLLLGFAFATAALVEMYQFEMASIKVLGGVLMQFLVLALIFRFVGPTILTWLRGGEAVTAHSPGAEPCRIGVLR